MTKLELMMLSQGLSDLYIGLETDLIHNIAAYLASGSINSTTAQWKIQMLASLGALNKQNMITISEYAGYAPGIQSEALTAAAATAIAEMEPGFQKLVQDGYIHATAVPVESTMARALKTYNRQAVNSLNMVNTVMAYKAKTAAQKVINDTAELAQKQEFLNMLNKAAGKVVTGAESRQAAMRQCINEMIDKGIPAFVDKRGREWSPEAYINMDLRTTMSNVAHQAQFERMDDYGINLIEVSSHSGSRPKCAKDQGKIFNRSGGGGYTTDLYGRKIRYYAWKDSSYGDPDGILGINCGHNVYPFTPGVDYQTYFPYDEEENSKAYQLSQRQRELERRLRKSKRECMALDTTGDKEGFAKASATLKQREDALKKFCADNGLSYRSDRTAVVGYSRTLSGKVRKSLTSAKNSDIINAEHQSDLGKFKIHLQNDNRISKEYYSAIKTKFSHGSDPAKKAFIKFVPVDSVKQADFLGTPHYNPATKSILMNYNGDLNNPRGKGATWFHEHGHLIDDTAGGISNNADFRKLLDDDYLSYLKAYGKKHKLGTFDKVQSAIGKDLSTMRKHSAISDIFEGISKGNVRGISGHLSGNPHYWDDDSVICSEAFAHMFEAQFDQVRYKEMQKYFPNALKKFEEILGGAL